MEEERKRPGVERVYQNGAIAVLWEPEYCIHVASCISRLPMVFDPGRRPWVDINAATPDEIAEAVLSCPTGALHFERLDGGEQEPVADETTAQLRPNGPIIVRGPLTIEGEDGEVVREDTRTALCRCGGSQNKPFCDGTHRRIGFRS